ncbi:MAG TPA: DUF5318 family protein [Actinomycetota bacterium]|nr:DUF5318 family protein [Actinomycetota bacterium]
MDVTGRSFDPTRMPPPPAGPSVDYRLARRAALGSLTRGSLDTADLCDAHPELLRAGKNIGEPVQDRCPVCSHDALRWVRYVYGDELRHNNGKVVYPLEWLEELTTKYDQFTCYIVEVCIDCAWNHLVRAFYAGRLYGTNGTTPGTGSRSSNGRNRRRA